jgi:hypothetical protein
MLRIGGATLGALGMCALLVLAAAQAGAQHAPVASRPWLPPPPPPQGQGMNGFNGGFILVEREYVPVIEREIVREYTPAEPSAAAPPPPRKPYVIGRNYSALPPQACLKLIEDGAQYYYCSGEWYRQVGGAQFRAVARP